MIDPVTLAVLKGRLEQIADEMDATLFRSAFNPIIAEAHDASHGLYHATTGETLVQGKSGLPIFVGAMSFAVKAVIEKAAEDGDLADGDVYIFNDPYDGGTHLSDFRLVRPLYRDGKVFCYLASVGHWHDVGGNVPGNYNPVATESFQEGMLIPPVKLYRKGELRQDIVDIMQANSRLPGSLYGDMNGQINALELGNKRLNALLDEYTDATVDEALDELRNRAAKLMAANISDLPDGTYSAEDFLDNDGINDVPLKIALDLTIKGDQMKLDFSRSSDACAGPVNIALSTAVASIYVATKHLFTEVPANAGVLEPIEVVIPESSLMNVRAPKPVGGYTETCGSDDAGFGTFAFQQRVGANCCAMHHGCHFGKVSNFFADPFDEAFGLIAKGRGYFSDFAMTRSLVQKEHIGKGSTDVYADYITGSWITHDWAAFLHAAVSLTSTSPAAFSTTA